ncbi:amine sulfotransferase-like [Thalassophryne amazonica]|uniref:amine sulfotransferase-like n=1 Tax=Thalassophryne amazonica TaxID=390379 RepID=UPI0014719755|nr:amine sulfotransferase-like [Thalassophryne amazonica]
MIRMFAKLSEVEQIYNLEIRDSDVFVVTYPKSGTIWMQQILLLIKAKGEVTAFTDPDTESNGDLIPWIELNGGIEAFITASSPRLRVSHLQPQLMPAALSQKKGKVIYVLRNPKDVLVSYYHFHKFAVFLETPASFDVFFEKFITGDVNGSSWFEHIKTWYSQKDKMNILFIRYEDMIHDLRSAVQRMSLFLGEELNEEQIANVVKHSTFKSMQRNPQASYERVPNLLLNQQQGKFMRKGTIGDWKHHFTVALNERFDQVFQKEMKDLPLSFIWDINDDA